MMRVVLAALCIFAFFILINQQRLLHHEQKRYSEELAKEKLIPNENLKLTVPSTDSAMLYTKALENPIDSLEKSGKNKILCDIPNLNPFDKVAMNFIENRAPHDCGKKDHGVLTKGILKFKADGLRAAFVRYIRRVEDDDFKIFLSKPEKLLKQKIKQAPIAKGR